jgi:hypothetical protein
MELPKELYIYIFCLTDDINSTKSLRLVSKTAYTASYDYFKLLLKEHIFIYYHHQWCISKDPNTKTLLAKQKLEPPSWAFFCHGDNTNSPNKSMIFKTTIRDFYTII